MVPLLRTLTFFLVFWLHQIAILPILFLRTRQSKQGGNDQLWTQVNKTTRFWGKLTCVLGGAKITVEDHSGLDPDQAVLLVSNHQGDFDIPVLLAYSGRRLAFVAKKELEHIPLVGKWMALMGCIFLDREDRRKQVQQIRQTVDQLKEGLTMVIFPEGTRSRGGEMKPFAAGSLNIAEKAGVPIVPVTLVNTHALFPKGAKLFPGGEAKIILHPAIVPAELEKEAKSVLHETVREIVSSGLK